MPYGSVNADTLVTSTSGGILGAGDASIMKNRIINGAMVINQRGYSGNPANGTYTLDRWVGFAAGAGAGKYSVSQSTTAPAGFYNSTLITSLSAYTPSGLDRLAFSQVIEAYNMQDWNWGTANAKTVTLSFWIQSSITGTFGGSLQNYAESYSYPFNFTISSANTWTQISITIAGPTGGSWGTGNDGGIQVNFSLGTSSSYLGTAGSWSANQYWSATGSQNFVATNGATWYLTGVQLEVGSSATGFEYRQYGQELALCQRYYYALSYGYATPSSGGIGNVTIYSAGTAAGSIYSVIQFPNNMRTAPTLNATSGTAYYKLSTNGSPLTFDTLTLNDYTNTSATIYNGSVISSSVTAGYSGWLRFNSNSAYIAFTAEL